MSRSFCRSFDRNETSLRSFPRKRESRAAASGAGSPLSRGRTECPVSAENKHLLQLKAVVPQAPASGATSEPAHITIRGLNKEFNGTVIYENFDLDIPRGRFVTVFGPNGCG